MYRFIVVIFCCFSWNGFCFQALQGQRNGLEHLMRIVKKDKQDLEVSAWRKPHGIQHNVVFTVLCRERLGARFARSFEKVTYRRPRELKI